MSARPSPSGSGSLELMLGEMRGQMRELIHNINNMAQQLDGLSERVAQTLTLAAEVQALKSEVTELRARVAVLEAQENKRAGALGLSSWVARLLSLLAALGLGGAMVKLFGGVR